MTDRPEAIQRRLKAMDEIGEVVGALRAIASAHVAAARGAIEAIKAYDAQVAGALDRLAAPVPEEAVSGPGLVIVIGAGQGFCGAYPMRLADAALHRTPPAAGLLVIGQRTRLMLAEAGRNANWSEELPATPDLVPELASQITDTLIDLSVTYPGPIQTVAGRDLPGQPIEVRRIWPADRTEGPEAPFRYDAPLTTLPLPVLIRGLLAEALFADVARALMEGLRAENQARVEAMARAASNLKSRRADVARRFQQVRQEQMTTEVIELSTGAGER